MGTRRPGKLWEGYVASTVVLGKPTLPDRPCWLEVLKPRDAQIRRLKNEVTALKQRLARRNETIAELTDFRTEALARLAAQHEEIKQRADHDNRVRRLPRRTSGTGPCS